LGDSRRESNWTTDQRRNEPDFMRPLMHRSDAGQGEERGLRLFRRDVFGPHLGAVQDAKYTNSIFSIGPDSITLVPLGGEIGDKPRPTEIMAS